MGSSCAAPAAPSVSCECALGVPAVRTRLRVGSMSTLLDAPLQMALANGDYRSLDVNLNWVKCPQGASAVVSMLNGGLVDMAIMHTEDAVAFAASGHCLRICGTFSENPREFGLHVSSGSQDASTSRRVAALQHCNLGLPDDIAGALMAAVLAEGPGMEVLGSMAQHRFPSVRRACEGMGRDFVQAVLWETCAARGLVDCGEWDLIGVGCLPWPSLLFVATKEALFSKAAAIKHFMHFARLSCEEFKANREDAAARFVSAKYGFRLEESRMWIASAAWSCQGEVEQKTLAEPLRHLRTLMTIPPDRLSDPSKLLAKDVCMIAPLSWATAPLAKRGGREQTADEDFDGPAEETVIILPLVPSLGSPIDGEGFVALQSGSGPPDALALGTEHAPVPAG